MENPIKMDDLEVPLFSETSIRIHVWITRVMIQLVFFRTELHTEEHHCTCEGQDDTFSDVCLRFKKKNTARTTNADNLRSGLLHGSHTNLKTICLKKSHCKPVDICSILLMVQKSHSQPPGICFKPVVNTDRSTTYYSSINWLSRRISEPSTAFTAQRSQPKSYSALNCFRRTHCSHWRLRLGILQRRKRIGAKFGRQIHELW